MSLIKNNKQELIEDIKKWIILDDQLKILNEKVKQMRELKSSLTNNISTTITNINSIDNNIAISGGKLKIGKKKDYKPLTFSYIETCLGKLLTDKIQVEYVIKYLKENREITCSPDIKRIYE
jgi:hypothetical protein|tara:strand:- start:550 stop:915 length:366 start_codon:yes stop_codon:yes gene_type:complete